MNDFAFPTNRLLLAGLFLGTGLAARAQTITLGSNGAIGTAANATAAQVGGGGQGYACTPYSLASPLSNTQEFIFAPGILNERVESWALLGDGTAVTGFTGNAFKFAPTGFGKARVTVSYSYDTKTLATVYCPDGKTPALCGGQPFTTPIRAYATRTYDFYKLFTQAQSGYIIKGPTCVPVGNPSVVYSVDPPVVSTQNQIQAGLGTDLYKWEVKYANGTDVPGAATPEGSTFIIPGGSLTAGSFTVKVQVGRCNAFSNPVSVTVSSDLTAAITPAAPFCLPVGSTANLTFNLATAANTTYSLGTTIGTLSAPGVATPAANISIAGTGGAATVVTLSGITAFNSGAITIVGVGNAGTCFGTQTVIRQVSRQLVQAQNQITPTCVTANTTGVLLTMVNAPAGTTWSVPAGSGWVITSQNGTTATVNTGAAGTSVTTTGSCGTSLVQPITVAGAVVGCDYSLISTGSTHLYQAPAVNGNTCLPAGNTYVFTLVNPATGATLETSPLLTHPTNYFQFQTGIGTAWPAPGYTVRVRVRNASPSNCLDITRQLLNQLRPAAGSNTPSPAARALGEARVYPNPTSDMVNIGLPEAAKGVAQVTIIDVLGKVQKALTTDATWTQVSVARLPAGSYTVRVVLTDGSTTTQNLLVQH